MTSPRSVGLLKVTAGLLTLMCGLVAMTLIATNPNEAQSPMTAAARAPASLVTMAFADQKEQPLIERTAIMEIPCLEVPGETQVGEQIRQVRLRSRLCQPLDVVSESFELVNVTNGFHATVFNTDKNVISSDYIHLAEGTNHLIFSQKLVSGLVKTSELKIVRSLVHR